MKVEVQVNDSANTQARFITWAPTPCRARVTDPSAVTTPEVAVQITARSAPGGGAVEFRLGTAGPFASSVTLSLPLNGTSVRFFSAGRFGQPSLRDEDVTIEAHTGAVLVGSVPVMVRIRKNANDLTTGERDRFLAAFAQLNNQGTGRFTDFRDMHTEAALRQAHGAPGFLPWHRAYLLDLERELQAIDPSVSLPYWRFDQAAPNLFNRDFIGTPDSLGNVQFSAGNPLQYWKTDGIPGIIRRPIPGFNTNGVPPGLLNEAQTLGLGNLYRLFRVMEGDPHGRAHTRFDEFSFISDPATAPRDPLFFLLHCNVDRLWAKWQRRNGRFHSQQAGAYDNDFPSPVGHRLTDTMWPWNGVTGGPRPPTAPGGTLATSPGISSPGPQPRVQDLLDYQGAVSAASRMGFEYDDVAYA
jgi:tyrosinase